VRRNWSRPRLWHKLMLLCVGTTLFTAIVSQAIVSLIASVSITRSADTLTEAEHSMYGYALELQPYFAKATPSPIELDLWLEKQKRRGGLVTADLYPINTGLYYSYILGPDGNVLAARPEAWLVGHPLPLTPTLTQALAQARGGKARTFWYRSQIISVVPILRGETPVGFGVLKTQSFTWWDIFLRSFLQMLVGTLVLTTFGSLIVGSLLGVLTARWVGRRLHGISTAADSWARGELSALSPEIPGDEFGELSSRLNRMAGELEQVIALRSEVAVLEERQAVLRELHDTVKQHAFAASLVVGSARACADVRDTAGLERALIEAEGLTRQIQTELAGILAEGRSPGEGGLLARLARLASEWERRSGRAIEARLPEMMPPLSGKACDDIARLCEEAITNAVKHSGSEEIVIALEQEADSWKLTVADDGVGFDRDSVEAGIGLKTMRQRAERLPGGMLTLRSEPGQGTCVTLRFQVRERQ
jgi:signal transduction histidine kinase